MSQGPKVRLLRRGDREPALAILAQDPIANLILVDAVLRLGQTPAAGELRSRVLGVWEGGELLGLASLHPAIAISAGARAPVVEALLPHLAAATTGLIKTREGEAALIWERVKARGRHPLLDRFEIGFALRPEGARLRDAPPDAEVRPARDADLEDLVQAARESLREEDRPDPFEGDSEGFRRWVAGRIGRARVIAEKGEPGFVGYADVQSDEGWLLQGVYTWPSRRRRGLAAAGVSSLCRSAFGVGAHHVQLAVVEGNRPGEALYESLGFERFERLRTILFS